MGWARLAVAVAARGILFSILGMLIWAVLPSALGWTPTTVMTGSMEPRIRPGDVVVARPAPPDGAALGHILLVDDPDHRGKLRLHRLVDFAPDGHLILRGDANRANDSTPVAPDAVHGIAVLRVPLVGLPMVWFAEKNWGPFATVVAAVAGLTLAAASGSSPGPGATPHDPGPGRRGKPPRDSPRLAREARKARAFLAVATIPVLACTALMTAPPAHAAFSAVTSAHTGSFSALSSFPCLNPARPDAPYLFYAFNEGSGSTAVDASPNNQHGALQGATTRVPGTCSPDPSLDASPALSLDGASGYISTPTKLPSPDTFTVEIWFKTSTKQGGKLIGFGDLQTGKSATADRHLYMTDKGAVAFGLGSASGGSVTTVTSPSGYNDGKWHQATATVTPYLLGVPLVTLYVDGNHVAEASHLLASPTYWGYWRIGYDSMSTGAWREAPTSPFFAGTVDNAAVYPTALNRAQIAAHYAAGR